MTPICSEDSEESAAKLFAVLRDSHQVLGQLLHSHRNYLLKIISEEIDSRLIARQGVSDIVQTAYVRSASSSRPLFRPKPLWSHFVTPRDPVRTLCVKWDAGAISRDRQ